MKDFETPICNYLLCFFLGLLVMAVPAAKIHTQLKAAESRASKTVEQSPTHLDRAIDLAYYYEIYKDAPATIKEEIKSIVAMDFASFDSDRIVNGALKQFLFNQRGY